MELNEEQYVSNARALGQELRERRESALSFVESPDTLYPIVLADARAICAAAQVEAE
jgi:hypothetical protein